MSDDVLILRTCSADMTSYGGFQWPTGGPVEAPDWDPTPRCGGGLHGLLWGEGSAGYLSTDLDAKWLVFLAKAADVLHGTGDLTNKCKARRGVVVYCGDQSGAIAYLYANGASGRAVVFGTATAGDRGTATAGDRGTATAGDRGTATAGDHGTATAGYGGTATAGDRGTATAGDRGTATAGDGGTATAGYGGTATAGYGGTATAGDRGTATAGYRGTATAGYRGTATAGDHGTATAGYGGTATAGYGGTATAGHGGTATAGHGGAITIQYWNGKCYKSKIGIVKDEDRDGALEPDTPYRLGQSHEFEVAK